jgi:plasmid maintenance system antidote protein VapI
MKEFYQGENEAFKQTVDEMINRFKWLLTKYGMDAKLPTEDDLIILSPDPFTGALNKIDAGKHKAQHENGEHHSLPGDAPHYPEQADPLASLPGKPSVPKGEGLKPKTLLESDEPKDDGHDTVVHEHTTPHQEDPEDLARSDVESLDDGQVRAEVEQVLASGQPVTDTGLGIDDEDLKKKIVDTVEFFLGKLPAASTELIKALHIRREELSAIIDHVRGGLTEALEAEFATAWGTLQEFLDKLNYALKERDTAALGAVSEAVDEFLHDVADLRSKTEAACAALKEKLSYGVDEATAAAVEGAILAERDAFEAGIDEALTNMEVVIGDMQTAQDTAFGNARQALANALNGKRTAFDNSLQRDAATFADALEHNYNAFVESVNNQRTAFEDSLAEKQATFDAAKARKL